VEIRRGEDAARPSPGARTLLSRFVYVLGLTVLVCAGVGIANGDALTSGFMAGVAGPGVAGGILLLDSHRFFAAYRLQPRERTTVARMLVATGVAFVLALAAAVAFASPAGLIVAVAFGLRQAFTQCRHVGVHSPSHHEPPLSAQRSRFCIRLRLSPKSGRRTAGPFRRD
jgi:hypothetical protein